MTRGKVVVGGQWRDAERAGKIDCQDRWRWTAESKAGVHMRACLRTEEFAEACARTWLPNSLEPRAAHARVSRSKHVGQSQHTRGREGGRREGGERGRERTASLPQGEAGREIHRTPPSIISQTLSQPAGLAKPHPTFLLAPPCLSACPGLSDSRALAPDTVF